MIPSDCTLALTRCFLLKLRTSLDAIPWPLFFEPLMADSGFRPGRDELYLLTILYRGLSDYWLIWVLTSLEAMSKPLILHGSLITFAARTFMI